MPNYEPEVNDYVVWDRGEYGKDEGWVYFKCDEEISYNLKGIEQSRYITIETSVRPKPKETLDCKSSNHHKMIHTLLLCHASYWNDLQYVKSRTPHERIDHYSQCDD